jgi:hypothetical protein
VQTAVNGGSGLLIFVPGVAHGHELLLSFVQSIRFVRGFPFHHTALALRLGALETTREKLVHRRTCGRSDGIRVGGRPLSAIALDGST